MALVFYLSHPQVAVDAAVPVPDWRLSDIGRTRALKAADAPWTQNLARIVSSAEAKALETARIFAAPRGLEPEVRKAMHENDRTSTGFLPPAEFETVANAFFASPFVSVRGWERAIDAQARVVDETNLVLAQPAPGDLLLVGHGAVGTLLLAHLLKHPISRQLDQPQGGGNVFAFEATTRRVSHRWRTLEDMANP